MVRQPNDAARVGLMIMTMVAARLSNGRRWCRSAEPRLF